MGRFICSIEKPLSAFTSTFVALQNLKGNCHSHVKEISQEVFSVRIKQQLFSAQVVVLTCFLELSF